MSDSSASASPPLRGSPAFGVGSDSPKRTFEGTLKSDEGASSSSDAFATRDVSEVERELVMDRQRIPVPRTRRRSVRPGVDKSTLESLPNVGASKEFLEALFAKHNIDGDEVSSKATVDKELRQTLGSPQNEQMVEAVSCAVMSHIDGCVGQHADDHGWFDERKHPLTPGAATLQASADKVQQWLWTILDALRLEPECLIISLVLLERALAKSALQLTPSTWRPAVLCSLVVAAKTWYDKAVFNVDFSERLAGYDLAHLNSLESCFLTNLDYRTTVSMSLYAKYFFALQDVLSGMNGPGAVRRSTWSPGQPA